MSRGAAFACSLTGGHGFNRAADEISGPGGDRGRNVRATERAGAGAAAAPPPSGQAAPGQPPAFATTVTVIETAPLPGVDLPLEKIPAPVQTAGSGHRGQRRAGSLAFLNRRLNGVYVNEMQGNPFQPDVNYRGYTASPLLGTPQGLRSTWTASG